MKTSKTLIESLAHLDGVSAIGDLRHIISNTILAVVRNEISPTVLDAVSKGVEAVSHSLDAEIKVAKMAIELRERGGQLGAVVQLGQLVIVNAPKEEPKT